MRIVVAGGTGVIGRRVIPQLTAAGYQVAAIGHTAARRELLSRLGAAHLAGEAGRNRRCLAGPIRRPAFSSAR
jgi:uncharacterized protein YbjT (DUF2867 family)